MPSVAMWSALDNRQTPPLALGSGTCVCFRAGHLCIPASFDPCAFLICLGRYSLFHFLQLPRCQVGPSLPPTLPPRTEGITSHSEPYLGHMFLPESGQGVRRSSGLGGSKSEFESRLYQCPIYLCLVVTLGTSLTEWPLDSRFSFANG